MSTLRMVVLLAAAKGTEDQASWPHWRGPSNNGSASPGSYRVNGNATNVLWKAPLPGKGCSMPVIGNGRIFLTAPVNGQDAVLAFDWQGKALWQRLLGAETPGQSKLNPGCNPSPIINGVSVFVAQVADTFGLPAENRMGEQLIASPVAVGNRLFIRGERHLLCVAGK